MAARKSPEPSPEKPKRPGRPRVGDPRPANRIIIKGSPERIARWRAYIERHKPPHLDVANGSLAFWELFERALAEEKATKKNR